MITNLTAATPAEIDEVLAGLDEKLHSAKRYAHLATKPSATWRPESERETAERLARLAKLNAQVEELEEEIAPLAAEYSRRGGWNRAFHCTAHGGHVHRDMRCSTCNWDTAFTWQTWLSGKDEAEIIKAISMAACTVCYPDAPVARMTVAERTAHSRGEVEARKAAKAEAKAAKELAKVPRAHGEALKVDELVDAFGLDARADHAAYESTWEGGRYAKGYSNAYSTYSDMVSRRAARIRRLG